MTPNFARRTASLTLAVLALAAPRAFGAVDVFSVTITPYVDYGVVIDTSAAAWTASPNLVTTMGPGYETLTSSGVKVMIVGTYNGQELQVQGVAMDTWTLATAELDSTDTVRLYGMFTTDSSGGPAAALFAGANNLITASPKTAGQPESEEATDLNHTMELSTASPLYGEMDKMKVGWVRRLWLRADAPGVTTTDRPQRFTITLTAVNGAGL